jgi:hypothetical protein
MIKSVEQQTENSILEMAMDYLGAPELHLSSDDQAKGRNTNGTFELLDRHIPTLKTGEYEITIHQTLTGEGIENANIFSAKQKVKVVGTPYQLKPNDIFSAFPPNASTGNYSTYLPHIVLNRSTIPWERKAFNSDKDTPWLALVVLNESDIDVKQSVKSGDKIIFDSNLLSLENTINLAHVIKRLDKTEQAVVIGNRLPKTNATNVIHLVAIDKDSFSNGEIPRGKQPFISLYNWQINCIQSEKQSLNGSLSDLNTGLLQLPSNQKDEKYNSYYTKGFVPLPHFMRRGSQTVSWYRSPLVPKSKLKGISFRNANHSDGLLRYDSNSKMLDTTYAAAWELGRMLTLKEKDIAQEIYVWKRSITQEKKQEQEENELALLLSGDSTATTLPDNIKGWMNNLLFLKQVPFNYLVPYEQMLPTESVRFFMLDMQWIRSLLDGAMSVGRILDKKQDTSKTVEERELTWSGLIIRSNVVATYPDLKVQAGQSEPVYSRKLGSDILFCMFQNEIIKEVDITLKNDALHFGFQKIDNQIVKSVKNADGSQMDDKQIEVNLLNNKIDWSTLKTDLEASLNSNLGSASLAVQLMETAPTIRLISK